MTGSPVAEEAARLLEVLQEWIAGASAGVPLATDSAECRLCPFCQVVHVARTTRPEVYEHLAGAGMELLAALRAGVENHERHWRASGRPDSVEHIDISD